MQIVKKPPKGRILIKYIGYAEPFVTELRTKRQFVLTFFEI